MKYFIFFILFGCASFDKSKVVIEQQNKDFQETLKSDNLQFKKELRTLIKEEFDKKDAVKIVEQKITDKELSKKTIIGRIEWVSIDYKKMKIKARVDTGAQTCSLHAENITEKEIDGKKYVQFESVDEYGKRFVYLKEVIKSQRVKSSNGQVSKRYVVKLLVTLGKKEMEVNVNLNDRVDLNYNFLIGRNLLMGRYIVDVSQSRLLGN